MVDKQARRDVANLTGRENWEVELMGAGLTEGENNFYNQQKKDRVQGPLTLGAHIHELLESEQARRDGVKQGIIGLLDGLSTEELMTLHGKLTEGTKYNG